MQAFIISHLFVILGIVDLFLFGAFVYSLGPYRFFSAWRMRRFLRKLEKHMRKDPHCTCNNCMEVYDAEIVDDDSQLSLFQ